MPGRAKDFRHIFYVRPGEDLTKWRSHMGNQGLVNDWWGFTCLELEELKDFDLFKHCYGIRVARCREMLPIDRLTLGSVHGAAGLIGEVNYSRLSRHIGVSRNTAKRSVARLRAAMAALAKQGKGTKIKLAAKSPELTLVA